MSQTQPRRPEADDQISCEDAIKYGDVFDVTEGLESKPIAPRDATIMLNAENQVLGKTLDFGAAAVMQAAANLNVAAGAVGPDQGNEMVEKEGVALSISRDVGGEVVVTEAVADHLLGKYAPSDVAWTTPSPVSGTGAVDQSGITIGEALEATAISVGDKPVDQGDAAAIRTAEVSAVGNNATGRSRIGTRAQAAATFNSRVNYDYNKITVSNVLSDAASELSQDKPVTNEVADGVRTAELRNKPDTMPTPGGVADIMATAARVNRDATP